MVNKCFFFVKRSKRIKVCVGKRVQLGRLWRLRLWQIVCVAYFLLICKK